MTLNKSHSDSIEYRRRLVAQLRLRGLTQREISSVLARRGIFNPRTAKPWSAATINSDVRNLRDQWREEAMKDHDEYNGKALAELREIRRFAWQQDPPDTDAILRSLQQERQLLGLDAPKDHRFQLQLEDYARQVATEYDLDYEEILSEAKHLLDEAKKRKR